MALRGSAEGRDFREGLCSAKGNRTPIARMKILSTNRYTMAPGGVPVNRGNRLPPEGASLCYLAKKRKLRFFLGVFTPSIKKRAKVLLFFDIRKYFCIFLQKLLHFAM